MQRDLRDNHLSATEVAEVVRTLEALDRQYEGVAMYVVLEDRVAPGETAAVRGPEPDGCTLAALAETYGRMLHGESGPAGEAGIAGVLEVLAATRFTPEGE